MVLAVVLSVAVLAASVLSGEALLLPDAAEAASGLAAAGTAPATVGQPSGPQVRPDLASAQAAARILGVAVQDTSATTESSTSVVNPDGSTTETTAAGPVRARQADGSWADLDSTLVERDGAVQPKVAVSDLSLSAGGGSAAAGTPLVTFAAPDVDAEQGTAGPAANGTADPTRAGPAASLVWRWPGVLPKPTLTGPVAKYANVAPGVDVTVAATRTGFKDAIVLTRRPAASAAGKAWRFPLAKTGLAAKRLEDGRLEFTASTGETVAVTAPALMWDAQRDPGTGDPVRTAAVSTQLETAADGSQSVVLTPTAGFLTDPKTVFPVTIDPSTHLGQLNDHWVSKDVRPGGTATYNSSVSPQEIRAGHYLGGGTRHHGMLHFDKTVLNGQYIRAAELSLYQTNTMSSCAPGGTAVYRLNAGFNDATTWANQPAAGSTPEATRAGCGIGWYHYDLTSLVQGWADGTVANYGVSIRATDDTQTQSYWRFYGMSNPDPHFPSLAVTYNQPPPAPTALFPTPGGRVNSTTPTLSAQVDDPDGQQVSMQVWIKNAAGAMVVTGATGSKVEPGGRSEATVGAGRLADGQTYSWQARANDGLDYGPLTPWQTFTVDTTPPGATSVSASAYTSGQWNPAGPASTFTFTSPVSAGVDVSRFAWRLDEQPARLLPANLSGSTATATTALTTLGPGWHTINAQALDAAGNPGPNVVFTFGSRAGLVSPQLGQSSSTAVELAATGPASTGVRFEYQSPTGGWLPIPPTDVTRDNTPLDFWPAPVANTGGQWRTTGLRWDLAATIAGISPPAGNSIPLTVRAVFLNGTNPVVDTHDAARPVVVTFDRTGLAVAHATVEFGPGTADLVNGNLAVTANDAGLDSFGASLTLSRTFNNTDAARTGPFGPGWTTSLASDDEDWTSLTDTGSAVSLIDGDGIQYAFTRSPTGTFRPVAETAAAQLSLTATTSGTQGPSVFTLSDPSGTRVEFNAVNTFETSASPMNPHTYRVRKVLQPGGSGNTTSFDYDSQDRPTQVTAPLPTTDLNCTPEIWHAPQAACRVLQLTYTDATRQARIASAAIRIYDPTADAAKTVLLDCYRYEAGRLVEQWDPRIKDAQDCAISTNALPTSYSYDSDGRLSGVTQAGTVPTLLGYDAAGRISTASQTPTEGSALTSTIRYDVAVGAAAADDDSHPDLNAMPRSLS